MEKKSHIVPGSGGLPAGRTLNLAIGDAPEIVIARQVTPGGHSMLSDRVFLGRDFRADEDQPGKQHVVLLTHRLWRERFGADRDIIGRDIRMDSIPYTVVGGLNREAGIVRRPMSGFRSRSRRPRSPIVNSTP